MNDPTVLIGAAVESLRRDYAELVRECDDPDAPNAIDREKLLGLLMENEWTIGGAEYLLHLATEGGAFMLRNALALALALDIEDGSLGF